MEKITNRGLRKLKMYRGFSLYNYQQSRTTKIYDVETVKIDLLNHIYTRRGTRLMMPNFGTSISDMIMEQMDDQLLDELESELRTVVDYDPRVEFYDDASLIVNADPDKNSIMVSMLLRFIELDYVDRLNLNIEFNN